MRSALPGLALVPALLGAPVGDDAPRELGAVEWGRRLEPALERAADSGKPVMLLFQEVPG